MSGELLGVVVEADQVLDRSGTRAERLAAVVDTGGVEVGLAVVGVGG